MQPEVIQNHGGGGRGTARGNRGRGTTATPNNQARKHRGWGRASSVPDDPNTRPWVLSNASWSTLKAITLADAPWYLPRSKIRADGMTRFFARALHAALDPEATTARTIVLAEAASELMSRKAAAAAWTQLSEEDQAALRALAPNVAFGSIRWWAGVRTVVAQRVADSPYAHALHSPRRRLSQLLSQLRNTTTLRQYYDAASLLALDSTQLLAVFRDLQQKSQPHTATGGGGKARRPPLTPTERALQRFLVLFREDAAADSGLALSTPDPTEHPLLEPDLSAFVRRVSWWLLRHTDVEPDVREAPKGEAVSVATLNSTQHNPGGCCVVALPGPAAAGAAGTTSGDTDVHSKVRQYHNTTTLHASLRAAAQDVAFGVLQQGTDCPMAALQDRVAQLVRRNAISHNLPARAAEIKAGEVAQGVCGQMIGAVMEDSIFQCADPSTSAPEELAFLARFLVTVERPAEQPWRTVLGGVPGWGPKDAAPWVNAHSPPPIAALAAEGASAHQQPPPPRRLPGGVSEGEVHAWAAWLRHCQAELVQRRPTAAQFDAFVQNACRANGYPALCLLQGVVVEDDTRRRGELDVVLLDCVTQTVLLVGEVKASGADLISARRQRSKLLDVYRQDVQRSLSRPSPSPTDQGRKSAKGNAPSSTLVRCTLVVPPPSPETTPLPRLYTTPMRCADALGFFADAPTERWVSITQDRVKVKGTLAPSRIGWALLRALGTLLGAQADMSLFPLLLGAASATKSVCQDVDEAKLAESVQAASTDVNGCAAAASVVHGIWMSTMRREKYEPPHVLLEESQGVGFANLLLVKPKDLSA